MTPIRRLILLAISILPVVALVVASIVFIRQQVRLLAKQSNVIVALELQRRFNLKVEVGQIKLTPLGTATIKDIRIANGQSFDKGTLASVARVVVRYDLRSILRGGGASAVSEVDVFDPSVMLVRRVDGSFNIYDLLKPPPGPKKPPFRGRVKIIGGKVKFLDYAVRPTENPQPIFLRSIDATLRASDLPVYSFDGVAKGEHGEFAKARFNGRYNAGTKHAAVAIDAAGASAALATRYAWQSKDAQVYAGKIDGKVNLDIKHVEGHYRTSIVGKGVVRDAAARVSMLGSPVTGIGGSVELKKGLVVADLKARFVGALVSAAGDVIYGKRPIELNVTFDFSAIDTGRLIDSVSFLKAISMFSPSGVGVVRARVTGAMDNPVVEAQARVPRAVIQNVPIQQVAVSVKYQNGAVELKSAALAAKGASVQVAGSIRTRPATILDLKGKFSNLDLGNLPAVEELAPSGLASGTFVVFGPASSPGISVTTRAANGSIAGIPFGSIEGAMHLSRTTVRLSSVVVSGVFGGLLRASGTVSTTGRIDLNVHGESIDIGRLADKFDETGYSGTAFFSGRITGMLRSPHVQGSIEAFALKAQEYDLDHVVATFTADQSRVIVNEAIVQVFPAEIRLSGEATGLQTDKIFLAAKASIQRLEISKLLDMAGQELDVTGIIGGDFTFSGAYLPKAQSPDDRLSDVVASGSFNIEDGTAFGYPISAATAGLDYSDDTLRLLNATITGDGAQLTASGTVNIDTRATDGSFSLDGFELSRLQDAVNEYAILAGTASASGTISGPWDDIHAAAQMSIDGLVVNFEKFDKAEMAAVYDGGVIASYTTTLSRGDQTLDVSGTGLDLETGCFASAKGDISNISVVDLVRIVRASPRFSPSDDKKASPVGNLSAISSGRINGSFDLSGCVAAEDGKSVIPDGKVDLTVTDIAIDTQQIQSVDLHASAKDGVVSLQRFLAISDDASLEVSGERAFEDGTLQMEVTAENVHLSRLASWLGSSAPDGILSATFNIDGPVDSPDIFGSIEVIKPGFGGFSVDSLRAGQIKVTPNRIEIPDILISAQGHQATASASVPWDWSTLSVPQDEPILASAQLDQQSLDIIGVLVPLVDTQKTVGTLEQAWFHLSGTLLDPQLAGALKISGGAIALDGFTNTFTEVSIDVGFEEDRIAIRQMAASSSQGGNVYVVPGGYIALGIMGASEINLLVVADGLTVGEKNLLGLKEDVTTVIDAGLQVSGPLVEPAISDTMVAGKQGGITITNSKFSFQTGTARTPTPTTAAVNPKLDITLRIGQDVVVSPPSMRLLVTGGGQLTGTALEPEIQDLKLVVQSGEINLATARLRIINGGTIDIAYVPPASPSVSVNLQATASVFAINNLRRQERYQITMQVSGQAANPQIRLSSNPPGLNREQMLAALGHVPGLFSSPESDLQSELAGVLTAAAASTLFAPIEDIFVRKFGFEQFSLQFSTMAPLSLYLSHQLAGKLYVTFYRRLSAALASVNDVEYQVFLNYRLNPNFQLSVGADDQQTMTYQIMYATTFN